MRHAGRPATALAPLALVLGLCVLSGCAHGTVRAAAPVAPPPPAAPAPTAPAAKAETGPGQPAVGAPGATPVPILMYHVIAVPPSGAAFGGLYVVPADFDHQLEWLAASGYHAVTLGAVWDHWGTSAPLPAHPIVITFDDGYRSVFTAALPEMQRLGFPGTLNLQLGMLGRAGGLDAAMVRSLIAAGWEVDAHTITHPDLTRIGDARLRHEVADSRAQIQQLFGVPARFFCYPSGRYNTRVIAAVRAAGYLAATTTHPGLATPQNPYALNRVRVSGGEPLAAFARSLQPRP